MPETKVEHIIHRTKISFEYCFIVSLKLVFPYLSKELLLSTLLRNCILETIVSNFVFRNVCLSIDKKNRYNIHIQENPDLKNDDQIIFHKNAVILEKLIAFHY